MGVKLDLSHPKAEVLETVPPPPGGALLVLWGGGDENYLYEGQRNIGSR
jgi:hypothetical protein